MRVETEIIESILKLYGFEAHVIDQKSYVHAIKKRMDETDFSRDAGGRKNTGRQAPARGR